MIFKKSRESEQSQSVSQPLNLEFLNKYNAIQTINSNQNENNAVKNEISIFPDFDKNKGFFDQKDVKKYDFFTKEKELNPPIKLTQEKNEQKEFEIWEQSLLKNERLRDVEKNEFFIFFLLFLLKIQYFH